MTEYLSCACVRSRCSWEHRVNIWSVGIVVVGRKEYLRKCTVYLNKTHVHEILTYISRYYTRPVEVAEIVASNLSTMVDVIRNSVKIKKMQLSFRIINDRLGFSIFNKIFYISLSYLLTTYLFIVIRYIAVLRKGG